MRFIFLSIVLIYSNHNFCQNTINETETLKNWDRKYFTEKLNDPFIFYVVYGNFSADFNIPKEYRTMGIPKGIDLMAYGPKSHPEVVKSFLEGYLWDDLKVNRHELFEKITKSNECFVIKGNVNDTNNLNYHRDIIGILTYLLDQGGVCVYDPMAFTFWDKQTWNERAFSPNGSVPRHHVLILCSEENGMKWFHTRGMIKYGRPDLSIHNVSLKYEEAVKELFSRFIEYEAFGGIIKDRQPVRLNILPDGMWCENKGDFEDPDFNNKHVEIHWK